MIVFLAHYLILLAGWTLTIKFVFPVAMALAEGLPVLTYVFWDFWWVAHLWLAWLLLNWQRLTWPAAVFISVAEIAIVVTKFVFFLSEPTWDIWWTNWFINKLFVLLCFCLMLPYMLFNRSRLIGTASADRRLQPKPPPA